MSCLSLPELRVDSYKLSRKVGEMLMVGRGGLGGVRGLKISIGDSVGPVRKRRALEWCCLWKVTSSVISLQEIGRQSTSLLGSLHLLGNLSSLQGDISDGLADLRETGDYFGFVRHVRGGLAESYYKVHVITVQQCSSATCCTWKFRKSF